MPCHHNLEAYIAAYIEGTGLADDPKGLLFRTIGRGTGVLTRTPLPQRNAYATGGRRSATSGIDTKLGNHIFRATGITAYLKKRRYVGEGGADGKPCQHTHGTALRLAARRLQL